MLRTIASIGTLVFLIGCSQPSPPSTPPFPKPVTIVVPPESEAAKPEIGLAAEDANALTGKWIHTIPDEEGKEKTVVLGVH